MRRYLVTMTGAVFLFAGVLAWAGAGEGTSDDAKLLDECLAAWAAGFNAHDAKAIAATYAEDADSASITGESLRGRPAIEKSLSDYFAKNPKVETKLTATSRRFIKPDVVVEDGRWEESGHTQEGLPTKGLFTTVLVKRGGTWLAVCDRGYVSFGEASKIPGK